MGEDTIKIIREIMADMKQYQFAEIVGIDHTVLSAVLNGRREVSKDMAKKLSLFSGRHLEDFIK